MRVHSEESVLRVGELFVREGVQTRSQVSLLLIHGGGENIGNEIERLALFIWRYTTFTRKFTAEKAAA